MRPRFAAWPAASVAALATLVACDAPPSPPPLLEVRRLDPGPAPCAPDGECCYPECRYDDTLDAAVSTPASLTTQDGALALAARPSGDTAVCGARVDTEDAPLAVFYALARDLPMRAPTTTCTRTELRCRGTANDRACAPTCVAWKTRWDEVREGVTDLLLVSPSVASGTWGANGLVPQWTNPRGGSCRETCFATWCWSECTATGASALDCAPSSYAASGVDFGLFSPWASTFLGALWTEGTAPIDGNPVDLTLDAAYARARAFQAAHPTHSVALDLVVDDYPNGCGTSLPGTVARANDAFVAWPSIRTNVLTLGNLNAYGQIAQYGFRHTFSIDPAVDVRGATTRALGALQTASDKWQYLLVPPPNGAAIDFASLRFTLQVGATDVAVPPVASRAACGRDDGFWLDFPEGPSGRIRVNLCPKTQRLAQETRARGAATYDCLGVHPEEATYVRAGDFDLRACHAAALAPRPLRFAWRTALPWNTYVRFRLQFASRPEDLAAADAFDFTATSWDGNAVGFGDLTALGLPPNLAWARLSVTLHASNDEAHRETPRVDGWTFAFTCIDAY